MQKNNDISAVKGRHTLKEFVPMVLAFFACLVLLGVYQNLRLYIDGVLDGFINKSLFLLAVHNLGFAAIIGLMLAFVFNILESRKSGLGVKVVKIALFVLLLVEGLLVEYYVRQYEILENDIFKLGVGSKDFMAVLSVVSIGFVLHFAFYYLHRCTAKVYQMVSRMYPFTIVLFSLFLAILNSDKKPINENKTQHLVVNMFQNAFDFNTYMGEAEYPLLKNYVKNDLLGAFFELQPEKPDIVVLLIEGLGSDFVGAGATYSGFTPYLDQLSKKSLYWDNFLSNSGVGFPALTSVVGSLPFGKTGFTNADVFIHRQTLFGILKENGYETSFYFGGNSSLNHYDKFLGEERVDIIVDNKSFGTDYAMQEADAAGITLGYPDKALFKKWKESRKSRPLPSFTVFHTLSSKAPFAVPEIDKLENKVKMQLGRSTLSDRQKRLVNKNTEIFASLLYSDEAVKEFITAYQKRPGYANTIFIVTGTHNLTDLPHFDELGRYKVPLMIFSPLLKQPQHINTLASHADIVPSLVHMLDERYGIEVPKQVAWLGERLVSDSTFDDNKVIPLFRDSERIKDYIVGNRLVSNGDTYKIDEQLQLSDTDDDNAVTDALENAFTEFRAINAYVIAQDKLVPKQNSLVASSHPEFSKTDLIWIESAFNGDNFDDAYNTAKNLAFDKEWDRSLLLCNYILQKIPGHADTEILVARIYAWKTEYDKAEQLLKKTIQKYPVYIDAYAALFDVFYWAETPEKALSLAALANENVGNVPELQQKIERARAQLLSLQNDQVVDVVK